MKSSSWSIAWAAISAMEGRSWGVARRMSMVLAIVRVSSIDGSVWWWWWWWSVKGGV